MKMFALIAIAFFERMNSASALVEMVFNCQGEDHMKLVIVDNQGIGADRTSHYNVVCQTYSTNKNF